jgi:hypothetical protein
VKLLELPIKKIVADPACQARVYIDPLTVAEYFEAHAAGAVFPPLIVFWDQTTYWLADGFTRLAMYQQRRVKTATVDVRPGDRRVAMLYATGANRTHGQRPTVEDRHKAVDTLLADAEWTLWSNRRIADQCGVSEHLVRSRRAVCDQNADAPRMVLRGGTVYRQSPRRPLVEAPPEEQLARIRAAEAVPTVTCPKCGAEVEIPA